MGINAGAFLAPLICGTLGENPENGWRVGYFAAGVGMIVSVIIQLALARRYLGEVGTVPAAQRALANAGGTHAALTPEEVDRLRVIFMLFVFVVLFWAAFEQAGGLMNIYAMEKTDRVVGAFEVPASWFQSLNPLFIVMLAPIFSAMWGKLGTMDRNPSTPNKMVLGLVLTGIGFLAMVAAAFESAGGGKAAMSWLVIAYFFHTMGELCISPVGLSMVTKLAPLRLASLMMGVWFLINFVANWLAGIIGSFAESLGDLAIFGGLAVTLFVFAFVLWLLSGMLVRWMHGAEDVRH
jgi:POT family proton-dependent oligopeptide transporter